MSWRTGGWLLGSAVLWMAVGVAGTLLLQRQAGPTLAGGGDELSAALATLDLNEQQQGDVNQVLDQYGESLLSLHQPVRDAEAAFWDQVLHAEETADQAIAAILTEDQRHRYEDLILGRSDNLDRSGNGNRR